MTLVVERSPVSIAPDCPDISPSVCFIALEDVAIHDNILAEWADFVSKPPVLSYSALLDQGLPPHIAEATSGFRPGKYPQEGYRNSIPSIAQKLSFWKPKI